MRVKLLGCIKGAMAMVTCPSTRDEPINLITLGLFVFWITYLGVVMSFKLFVLTSICVLSYSLSCWLFSATVDFWVELNLQILLYGFMFVW